MGCRGVGVGSAGRGVLGVEKGVGREYVKGGHISVSVRLLHLGFIEALCGAQPG